MKNIYINIGIKNLSFSSRKLSQKKTIPYLNLFALKKKIPPKTSKTPLARERYLVTSTENGRVIKLKKIFIK